MKKQRRFALVDCNNFYVSCERVFNPALHAKPVVILSSNDACIIARSNEVKAMGVPMGAPVFKWRDVLKRHNVHIYSANFPLYGDMSARVLQTLATFAADIEVYSVDEAFVFFPSRVFDGRSLETCVVDYASFVRNKVKQWTGIPTTIGVGPTKTLAKVAHYIAKKKFPALGVFDITTVNRQQWFSVCPVEEIWGVGRRYSKLLKRNGINTVGDFVTLPDAWVRKHMTVMGLKTLHELRGISCISLEEEPPAKKTIGVSRLFGAKTQRKIDLKQAVAAYITIAAEKVRQQGARAQGVHVFVCTSRYHDGGSDYAACYTMLASPSSYNADLITAAYTCLNQLYRPGKWYRKVGVLLTDFVWKSEVQLPLQSSFCAQKHVRKDEVMMLLDRANRRWGRHTLFMAAAGVRSNGARKQWEMRQQCTSNRFTTSWHELLTV